MKNGLKPMKLLISIQLLKNLKFLLKNLNASFKILATGEITKALTFKGLALSQVAKNKIIAAGGNIE